MNTLQQEPGEIEKQVTKDGEINPAFDENVLKAAGRTAQIEQKSVIIASQLLDAVMVAYDEDKPNKALVPVFIQHITEAIATARAEGAAEERLRAIDIIKSYIPTDDMGNYGGYGAITENELAEMLVEEIIPQIEALTTKEST